MVAQRWPHSVQGPAPSPTDSGQQLSRRAQIVLGVLLMLAGFAIIALAIGWIPYPPEKFNAPPWVVGAAGAVFMLAGPLMLIPDAGNSAPGAFLGAAMTSLFALVGSWVAFGPGEREFSSGVARTAGSIGTSVGEYAGRAIFGVGAIILIAVAAWAWMHWWRLRQRAAD